MERQWSRGCWIAILILCMALPSRSMLVQSQDQVKRGAPGIQVWRLPLLCHMHFAL